MRQRVHPILFHLINLFFTSIIQNVLLLYIAIPTSTAALQGDRFLSFSDYTLALAALVVVATEFTADNQQQAFQAYKHAYLAKKKGDKSAKAYNAEEQWPGSRLDWSPEDAERGFVTRGLWRYSRHPNFLCEQAFWVSLLSLPGRRSRWV